MQPRVSVLLEDDIIYKQRYRVRRGVHVKEELSLNEAALKDSVFPEASLLRLEFPLITCLLLFYLTSPHPHPILSLRQSFF